MTTQRPELGNVGQLAGARPERRDAPAIVTQPDRQHGMTISHGETERLCVQIAAHLKDRYPAGSRVAVLGESSAWYLIALLAIARAGLVSVPMSPRQGAAQLGPLLASVEPVAVFADDACRDCVPDTMRAIRLDHDEMSRLDGRDTAVTAGDEDIAFELFTSGSSGAPKGVLLAHRALLFSVLQLLAAPPSDVRVLVAAPLFHMNGLMTCLSTLAQGGTILLLDRFDPERYLRAIHVARPSVLVGVPAMFTQALAALPRLADASLDSVIAVVCGSAPLRDDQRRAIETAFTKARVINSYGATEAFAIFGPHPLGLPTPPGSVGAVQPGVQVRFAEGSGVAEGRLLVRTPASMSGYDGAPAGHTPHDWYDTKDLARVDGDGFYYIIGRADDVINCGGEKVYPEAVEAVLDSHPGVCAAAVVGVTDQVKGEVPVAFVVAAPGARLDVAAVKQHALDHGPAYAHPRYIEVIDELPLNPAGKVDKRVLAARAVAARAIAGQVAE